MPSLYCYGRARCVRWASIAQQIETPGPPFKNPNGFFRPPVLEELGWGGLGGEGGAEVQERKGMGGRGVLEGGGGAQPEFDARGVGGGPFYFEHVLARGG